MSSKVNSRPRSAYALAVSLQRVEERLGITPTAIEHQLKEESSTSKVDSFDTDDGSNDGTIFKARTIDVSRPNKVSDVASEAAYPVDEHMPTTKVNREVGQKLAASESLASDSTRTNENAGDELQKQIQQSGKKKLTLIAGALAGVVVIGIAAFALLGQGGSSTASNNSQSSSASVTVLASSGNSGSLGTPDLSISQAGTGSYELTWKYVGEASNDLVKVIATSNGVSSTTNLSSVTSYQITAPNQPTCYAVQVANHSLTEVSSSSNSVCVN